MNGAASPNRNGGVRGLPGFLRRSVRTYEEEEDVSPPESQEIPETQQQQQQQGDQVEEKSPSSTQVEGENSSNDHDETNTVSTTTTTDNNNNDNDDDDNADDHNNNMEEEEDESVVPPLPSADKTTSSTTVPKAKFERQVSYKETQFDKVMTADVVSMSELRKLAWNGTPSKHRAQAWKFMLGYVPVNKARRDTTLQRKRSEYKEAIRQHYDIDDDIRTSIEQETLRQVLVDVPRTAPEVGLFRDDRIRRCLARLLYIWAMRHPASSYVQGINDIATPLVTVFLSSHVQHLVLQDNDNDNDNSNNNVLDGSVMAEISDDIVEDVEADVYWCLTNLLAGIQDHYTSDQPGVQRMVARLEELVNRIDAKLSEHLKNVGIEFMQFAFKWMNCLLLREFKLKCVMRLWDTYIAEGDGGFEEFHVYVCAAFLCQFSTQLQSMEFDEIFGFLQQMPTDKWTDTDVEMLLSQAFVLSTLFEGSDAHLTSG
mmetsp:Transcript_6298/g.9003  ORF Transcript_6298/g.9003 Transcript_6298/m.9003 type:complete len:483 (-) Transcript_6298:123-1571(-)